MEGEVATTETQPEQTVQKAAESSVDSNPNAQQEKLSLELEEAAHSILEKKGEDIKNELAGKSQDEKEEILQDPEKRHIKSLYDLNRIYPGDHKTESEPNGIDFTKGNPAFVEIDGQPRRLLYIEAADEKNFTCRLEGLDQLQTIPRKQVYDAQLLSEKDSVLTAFPEEDKELLEAYIGQLSSETISTKEIERVNKLIENQRGTVQSKESQESAKSPEDKLIDEYIETVKQEIETLKKDSQDTKKQEELLVRLKLGQMANGQAGIVFKTEAVKSLQDAGYSDIPEITEQQKTKSQEELRKILEALQQENISKEELQKIQQDLAKGNPNIVINEILINKIKGLNTDRLEQLIFKKKMTEEELTDIVDSDEKMKALLENYKKFGKGFLLILLIALFGAGADFGKSVSGQR